MANRSMRESRRAMQMGQRIGKAQARPARFVARVVQKARTQARAMPAPGAPPGRAISQAVKAVSADFMAKQQKAAAMATQRAQQQKRGMAVRKPAAAPAAPARPNTYVRPRAPTPAGARPVGGGFMPSTTPGVSKAQAMSRPAAPVAPMRRAPAARPGMLGSGAAAKAGEKLAGRQRQLDREIDRMSR